MDILQNIAEYYDELFPVSEEQKVFYSKLMETFTKPVRFLRIGCGTGTFEHNLAKDGSDVTGLETSPELLESANRKRRTQLMAVRYFQMTALEMTRFLGKGFYNIISILNDRIIFTHDQTLMAKLFYDCRQLVSNNGFLVISLTNYKKFLNQTEIELPVKESLRSKLFSKISKKAESFILNQKIENSSGKLLTVTEDAQVNLLTPEELETYAKEAGFSKVEFYEGFNLQPLTDDSQEVVAVISA